MSPDEQVERWVTGESVHNDERGECCPDFSCCKPELQAPEDVRQAFAMAFHTDPSATHLLLGSFLGAALKMALAEKERPDSEVYIAGG